LTAIYKNTAPLDNIAAFGSPVVPLVYENTLIFSGVTLG
jgi:hypothetical protein